MSASRYSFMTTLISFWAKKRMLIGNVNKMLMRLSILRVDGGARRDWWKNCYCQYPDLCLCESIWQLCWHSVHLKWYDYGFVLLDINFQIVPRRYHLLLLLLLTHNLTFVHFFPLFRYFSIVFLDPPEITKRPINQSVRVGGVASFYCAARGEPTPTIVWRKNGKKVSGTQSRYSVTQINGQSILRIEPVRAGRDEAPYECFAENGVGDAVSAEATLIVYESMYI